jgi:hypothetical protein
MAKEHLDMIGTDPTVNGILDNMLYEIFKVGFLHT